MTGRAYAALALDGECGKIHRLERTGDITPREASEMLDTLHSLRSCPLEAGGPHQDRDARERAIFLADLRWHWGEFYRITWDRGYRAARRDNGAAITWPSAAMLPQEIEVDSGTSPVPVSGGFMP